jgi:hypothetical protein
MPDQYVLDFVNRRENPSARKTPSFIQYTLVSSHLPWSELTTVVQDWSQIKNGQIYRTLPRKSFGTSFRDLSNASEPYIASIIYDFEVLQSFILEFVNTNALLIIFGDHQPAAEITARDPARGVPIHVLSRDARLIEPFMKRGYTKGMQPELRAKPPGLETFMPHFLIDFSSTPENPGGN